MSGVFRNRFTGSYPTLRSSDGTPIESGPSMKQRFIDAAKMLLDIAKESADAYPPLKSCLGGISALIKHYDEYKDVEDKLNDLIPWLEKLLQTLAKVNPGDDPEEITRRSKLARSLEDIGKQSLALSDKGKVARVLDKKRDSQKVVGLVEKLRQAILIYQPLPVRAKIESILARLDRLRVGGGAARNNSEFSRRKCLFETFEGIKVKLQSLSEQVEKERNMTTACDLADDLRGAIVEYQFAQQEAIYEQSCRLIDAGQT